MSSAQRLRARIARDDLDGSQVAKASESFVLIGTPLPPLFDRKSDPNEVRPVWQQTAEDEQGRRRFQGAFTAGYHNTVGSKEGWTPSTFVSSRRAKDGDNKPTPTRQRVEDFMDEEDLAELEQSRQLSQRAEYSSTEKTRHDKGDVLNDLLGLGSAVAESSSGPASAATSGLVAPRSSLGHRILSKMGWKPGWGLGPFMTKTRRRALEMLYTGALSAEAQSEGNEEVLIPPPDTPMPGVVGDGIQRNTYGLGWRVDQQQSSAAKERFDGASSDLRLGLKRSTLAALEDDDQADVYGSSETLREAMERRKRDALETGTSVAPRRDDSSSERLTLGGDNADVDRRRWKDGQKVPSGFIISEKDTSASSAQIGQEWYAPPEVPKDWTPDPTRVWNLGKIAQVGAPTHHQMNAADRANLLGEARIPGPPPSMSSYLSNAPAAPPGPPPTPPSGAAPVHPMPTTVDAPGIDVATAKAALTGFVPFGNDEAKQERYKAYLRLQSDPEQAVRPYSITPGQTAQQTLQELQEFARSASIFKPMSSVMASRFASAATVEGSGDANAPTAGLYQPTVKSKEEKEAETKRKEEEEAERLRHEKEENMTDRQRAAKANMFGHLTREVSEWFPPRLLCKRFGVPDPHPDRSAPSKVDSVRDAGPDVDPFHGDEQQNRFERSYARREIMRGEARWEQSRRELIGMVGERKWEDKGGQPIAAAVSEADTEPGPSSTRAAVSHPIDLEQVGLGEDEGQLREIDNFVKPSRDVFRSVFASDEEDEQPDADESNKMQMAKRTGEEAAADSSAAPGGGPIFVPRSKRTAKGTDGPTAGPKKRKKEKKKAGKGALIFEIDDEEGDAEDFKPLKRAKSSASVAAAPPADMSAADAPDYVPRGPPAAATKPTTSSGKPGRMKASDLF